MRRPVARSGFNMVALLRSAGLPPLTTHCTAGRFIFSAGDAADSIMYVLRGTVKISVMSRAGRQAIVAIVRAGDFFGEACLAGQLSRASTATAISPSAIVVIERSVVVHLLHTQPAFCERFIERTLIRNVRLEADLLDQLVNSCEQRLARTLLLLANYGRRCRRPRKVLPPMSQSTLAGIVGSTRSRVNYFMTKFERLGFIDTNDGLTVNRSLLRVTRETTHAR